MQSSAIHQAILSQAIIIAGLGENQHTAAKRYCFMKKGYMKGQPDIVIIKSTTASALSLKVKPIIIKSVNNYKITQDIIIWIIK